MTEGTTAPIDETYLSRCPLHEVNPLDPAINQAPHAYFRRLRDEAPVFRDSMLKMVHVSRYDDVMEVLRLPEVYSSVFGSVTGEHMGISWLEEEKELLGDHLTPTPTLLTNDPPSHTRFKKLAMKGFNRARVDQMTSAMEAATNELVDQFIAQGGCEFRTAFADKLPSMMIADAVGVDRSMLPQWHIWLQAAVRRFDLQSMSRDERISSARLQKEMNDFLSNQIAAKRANPGDDIISDLVQATLVEEGDPRPLTDGELHSIFGQVFVAGQETTVHSLTAGIHYLISNPGQMEMLRADPSLIPNFVEETIRFLTPVNNMFRRVLRDTTLNGFEIDAGEMVMVKFGSANHDERQFPDPERFDIARANAKQHLAFGKGIHHCLGAELSRKELAVAFRILLERLRNLRMPAGAAPVRYVPNHLLRGIAELPIEFDAA